MEDTLEFILCQQRRNKGILVKLEIKDLLEFLVEFTFSTGQSHII